MSEFILNSHFEAKDNKNATISQDLLRKYILYARNEITPSISSINSQKISSLYSDLRKESLNSGIPITVRHVESIIRVSEAFAKLRLSPVVSKADFDNAISLILESFLNAQKFSIAKQLRSKFSKYFEENSEDLIYYILKLMISEKSEALGIETITKSEFTTRCKNNNLIVPEKFFSSDKFLQEGFALKGDKIVRS